jgi:uncharacterized membrane protein YheB (UPF0754 family)
MVKRWDKDGCRRMSLFWLVLLSMVIGAVIGGGTNFLAIKMLFRPLKPLFIGRLAMPFTPGLIPKRRYDIALQLGRVVEQHLLTAEGLRRYLVTEGMEAKGVEWTRLKLTEIVRENPTIAEVWNRWLADLLPFESFEQHVLNGLERNLLRFLTASEKAGMPLNQLISDQTRQTLEEAAQQLSPFLIEGVRRYLSSPEGREVIGGVIQQQFGGRGVFSMVVGMFLDEGRLASRLVEQADQVLQKPAIELLVRRWMGRQTQKLWEQTPGDLVRAVGEARASEIIHALTTVLRYIVSGERRVGELPRHWLEKLDQDWIPFIWAWISRQLSGKTDRVLAAVPVAGIVRQQVDSFPLVQLERIILSVASRELKMITWLGALLGGVIGVVQALFIYLAG